MKSKRNSIPVWLVFSLALVISVTALTPVRSYGDLAPLSFTTTTLDGNSYDSSKFQEYDLIMMNFWAEWCRPCVVELPALQQIHNHYPNVLVLGVWVGSDSDQAAATAENAGVSYPLLHETGNMYAYLNISGGSYSIPQTRFFDREGNPLGSAYIGSRDYEGWSAIVDQNLANIKPAETVKKPVITSQPKSVKGKVGKKVTFKVAATGKKLSYQWYYRESAGAKWKKVTKKGTSAAYSFKAKKRHNGYRYRCLVRNSAGKVYSKSVKLAIRK